MKYYIVKEGQENKILKVKDEDVASFEKDYKDFIVHEADSICELLIMHDEHQYVISKCRYSDN